MPKPKAKSTDKIYIGAHYRTEDQLKQMEDIAQRDICFMCPEHIDEFYTQKGGLIAEGKYSYLVKNGYPYENTLHHLLIIPKAHITTLAEVSNDFWVEALDFYKKQVKDLGVKGAALAMRFGEPSLTGATVHHLHMHLVVPRPDIKPEDKPVKFRMSHKERL